LKSPGETLANCSFVEHTPPRPQEAQVLWKKAPERVTVPYMASADVVPCLCSKESGCLGSQPKMGGKFHLKLNTGERPIANKYREGKMKRTLKRELKVLEIVEREAYGTSSSRGGESAGREDAGGMGVRSSGQGERSNCRRPGLRTFPLRGSASVALGGTRLSA